MALQDGSPLYGLPGTITIAGLTLIAENVSIDRPGGRAETRDQNNAPNSQYFWSDQSSGSMTVQMDDAADATTLDTAKNAQGGVFAMTVGGAAENWVLTSVGQTYTQGAAYKVNVTFTKAISVTPTP
jgi:hypothetical protein